MDKLIVGCGYLGRRVARAWLAEGDRVFALTRSAANAADLQSIGVVPIIGDICQPESLSDLPGVNTVLFAVGYDRGSGKSQREVYVDGLKSVLQVVGPGSVRSCQRFIYVSSSSVYGQSEGEWVDESAVSEPVQPGGVCCREA